MPLKKGAIKKVIRVVEKNLYKEKATEGFDAQKYNGVTRLNEDALAIQKKLRDEWERHFS